MSNCPTDLKYTSSHEWINSDGDIITIGITEHAQSQLGDLVFVELPLVDDEVTKGKEVAVVESVKTAADVYSPVTGKVIAINEELNERPELINEDPYGTGWLFKVQMHNPEELEGAMTADQYAEQNID